jgi:hypothetical protein
LAANSFTLALVAAADGLRDDFIAGGEEVVDLVEGVAVGAAHEAVADEADAELFLGHRRGLRVRVRRIDREREFARGVRG